MRQPATLFTLGYERASFKEFLQALQRAGVQTVIDVRDLPLSRRPGFSKRQLAAGLEEHGIAYHHLKGLGTPKDGRVAHRRGDMARFWDIVDTKLASDEAARDLSRAAAIMAPSPGTWMPTCLICFEADHRACHRDRVGEILGERMRCSLEHLSPLTHF